MKEDKYKKKPCQESGLCNRLRDIRKKRFTQIYKDFYGDAMFVSLSGAQIWSNMAAGNQQKHLFLSFPTYA